MNTSRYAWIGYSLCVGIVAVSSATLQAIWLLWRGRHPEVIHGLWSLCFIITGIGVPLFAVFGYCAHRPP